MYTFPNKLRNLAIAFMVIGFLGLTYGFLSAPATLEESKAIVAASHSDGHGTSHEEASHDPQETNAVEVQAGHHEDAAASHSTSTEEGHDVDHDEHVFHQLSNKPWAALYVAAFFLLYDCAWSSCILRYSACRSSRVVSCIIPCNGRNYSISSPQEESL